jgi:PadR family transcriptional regulator AphA
MAKPRLTETSFIVLGLLDLNEPATPYDLKQFAGLTVFNFWSIPHTQIYTECARLAEAGLLSERREEKGRRRRFYKLTARGRRALEKWRGEPADKPVQARDLATLKLFLGADPKVLATKQLAIHERLLAQMEAGIVYPGLAPGVRLTTELGIELERVLVKFWLRWARGVEE